MRLLFPSVVLVFSLALIPAGSTMAQESSETPRLNAEELPVSLERIKRQLDRLPVGDWERNLLRLSYYVEVYGRAPRINVIQNFDIHNGPVPYGAPSHAEMIAVTMSREFKDASRDFVPGDRVDLEAPLAGR